MTGDNHLYLLLLWPHFIIDLSFQIKEHFNYSNFIFNNDNSGIKSMTLLCNSLILTLPHSYTAYSSFPQLFILFMISLPQRHSSILFPPNAPLLFLPVAAAHLHYPFPRSYFNRGEFSPFFRSFRKN